MAKKVPVVKINGRPAKATADEGWTFTHGARQSTSIFEMRKADAEHLVKYNVGPCYLEISYNNKQIGYSNLYVLHEAPCDSPNVRRILVADRRWMWGHRNIERDYNCRRNVGVRRFSNNNTPETAELTPEVQYWNWSLHPITKKPWKASEIIKDILDEVVTIEMGRFGIAPIISMFPEGGLEETDKYPIENLSFAGEGGETALERLISIIPALGITLDKDGDVIVYRRDMGPKKVADVGLGRIVSDRGMMIDVNNRLLKPIIINFLVERECEIRINSVIDFSVDTQAAVEGDIQLVNVAPVPDYQLIDSLHDNKLITQGTWVPVNDLVRMWQDPVNGGHDGGDGDLTDLIIREGLVPLGADLFQRLIQATAVGSGNIPMLARIQCILTHFRTSYQITASWMDRIKSLRTYRIAVINESTGGRAPSLVYSNHSIIPSMRGLLDETPDNQVMFYNIEGYQDNLFPMGATRVNPAPARVELVDSDQGIVHITYRNDLYGNYAYILPSLIDHSPNEDIRHRFSGRHNTADALSTDIDDGNLPQLTSGHKIAIIVSAVPASPNNNNRLHRISVTPEQVKTKYGMDLGECEGPEMDIYLGPGMQTAKIGWLDIKASETKKCFGFGDGKPNLEGLILNEGPSNEANGANLNEVAIAYAAQVYAALADRIEGFQVGTFNPSINLRGWQESLAHNVEKDGKVHTSAMFLGKIPRMNVAEYLDSSTRRALFRLAQPPVGV